MNNFTYNSPILMIEGFDVPDNLINPLFALLLVTYLIILTTNIGVMLLIMMDKNLHQPMYLLFFSLSFNDVFGNTVLLPRLMSDVFTMNRSISFPWCVSQAFFTLTYGVSCHTVMMAMAFDRYVAICHPLRYTAVMSTNMLTKLTVSAWSSSIVLVSIPVGLSLRLTRCRSVIFSIFCDNTSLFMLSCQGMHINNIYGLTMTIILHFLSMSCAAFTYVSIMASCLTKKNKELNRKAVQTCASHLVMYMIMLCSGFFVIIIPRFHLHPRYRMMAGIVFHILPANVNPIIYGLHTKELKTKIRQIIHSGIAQLRRWKMNYGIMEQT